MTRHPFRERTLEAYVVFFPLALDPFVTANFLTLCEELLIIIRF